MTYRYCNGGEVRRRYYNIHVASVFSHTPPPTTTTTTMYSHPSSVIIEKIDLSLAAAEEWISHFAEDHDVNGDEFSSSFERLCHFLDESNQMIQKINESIISNEGEDLDSMQLSVVIDEEDREESATLPPTDDGHFDDYDNVISRNLYDEEVTTEAGSGLLFPVESGADTKTILRNRLLEKIAQKKREQPNFI